LGDSAYDAESIRQGLRDRGIIPFLAKRNTEHGSGLGRWRWVVERTFAWLNQFRRLRVRYEKAGGHSRGISVSGMRCDLLALLASE
jgi:transposase